MVEDILAEGLLEGRWKSGDTVFIDAEDGDLKMARKELVPTPA